MANEHTFHVRPAGRHLLTIGRDLIQDQYAAIVELVKNAYDADSSDVTVTFVVHPTKKGITIHVEDHGHGMTRDTVLNNWLVPSTSDKLKRAISPGGRIMQGRKGIGRYAAAILGDELLLETVATKEKTIVLLDWTKFEKADYLEDVDVLVESIKSDASPGTSLTISGNEEHLRQWSDEQIKKLHFELRKLISPLAGPFRKSRKPDQFITTLVFKGFYEQEKSITITPYPVVDLFDYRIHGQIHEDGKGVLTYECQKARNTINEKIKIDLEGATGCGTLRYDLRVYDREPEAIDQLIGRGLKDTEGEYVGRLQAKQLLNELNGIGVYRNGFRIRPLGDPDFDWLELNKQRIQEPTMRIGSNQVIGLVEIEPEEASHLEEKSARDGLRDNIAFRRLKHISQLVVGNLEIRRATYRIKAGLSRSHKKVEAQLDRLYGLQELRKQVNRRLAMAGVPETTIAAIDSLLIDEEKDKNQVIDEIRETVAVYQGQATLGKILKVVLHEARRPLNFFKNQIPNLVFWADELEDKRDPAILDEVIEITPGLASNSETLVQLFNRLDPLAAAKRGPQRNLPLRKTLDTIFRIFEDEIVQNHIGVKIDCPSSLELRAWEQDIYAVVSNLIDNSLYWLINKKGKKKEIAVTVTQEKGKVQFIDFRDSGPGIEPSLISSGVIFDPEFTTKPPGLGQGLGLAIAGEAAERNGFELKAIASDEGAYFRLDVVVQKEDNANG